MTVPRLGLIIRPMRSLLAAAMAAVFLGLPTGLTMLILLESNNTTVWLMAFPVLFGAAVLVVLRRWRARPLLTPSGRRRRAWVSIGSVATLLTVDALVFTGVITTGNGDCTWEYSDEVAADAGLASGLVLTHDGRGTYSDAVDGVDTFIKHSLKLSMFEPQVWAPKETVRKMIVDLSTPVPESGSVPLGVLETGRTLKSFWHQDAKGMVRTVHAIPQGTTVPSDRTELELTIAGIDHRLTMGTWSGRYCDGTKIGGAGTSAAMITRSGPEEFTVDAPAGSVARLWDMSGRAPIDKGLYFVALRAEFRGR